MPTFCKIVMLTAIISIAGCTYDNPMIVCLENGLGLLLLGYLFYQKDNESKQLERQTTMVRDTCDAITNELTQQLNVLRQLTLPGNKILSFQATPVLHKQNSICITI